MINRILGQIKDTVTSESIERDMIERVSQIIQCAICSEPLADIDTIGGCKRHIVHRSCKASYRKEKDLKDIAVGRKPGYLVMECPLCLK